MNKNRMILDEMDIQAVESKLNDVTVTAIPMSSVTMKQQQQQQNSATQQKHLNYNIQVCMSHYGRKNK